MNKAEYLKRRQALMNEAKEARDGGNIEQSNSLLDQVEELANEYNEQATNLANQNALEGNSKMTDISNATQQIDGTIVDLHSNEQATYENAWAKQLLGRQLTDQEIKVYEDTNRTFLKNESFTHTTKNTPTLIPDTVVAGIWKRAEEQYPLWGDIKGFAVTGTLTFNKHTAIESGDAAWYDEDTETADEKNTFGQIKLDGKELSKSVTVSWKLKSMAVPEFIAFLEQELADRIGVALGVAAYSGNGTDQPTGIKTALTADAEGKKQIQSYTGQIGYADVTKVIASIHSSYTTGAVFYTNNATVWNQLANITDKNGRPYFIADTTAGGVGRLFGYVVKADAGIPDGEVLFGNVPAGVVKNQNAPLSITIDTHAKQRKDDYVAYTVIDSNVLDVKALAVLAPGTTTASSTTSK